MLEGDGQLIPPPCGAGRGASPVEPSSIARKRIVLLGALVLGLVVLVLSGAPARAHLLPAQTATLRVIGASAYTAVSVPISAIPEADLQRTGRLEPGGLPRARAAIARAFQARFLIFSGKERGRPLFTWVLDPRTEGPPVATRYVVVLQRTAFSRPPQSVSVVTDLFGSGPGEDRYALRASAPGRTELSVLARATPRRELFRSWPHVLLDFFGIGVEHILTGPDHLLFLLTVIVGATGWRYWASVITTFTLAHSLTLALAAFGLAHAPARVVEPAIAASIVLLGLDNLRRGRRSFGARVALVGACGLLHGLGFAGALADLGLDNAHKIASLVGFNLGVEAGQVTFLGLVLALAVLLVRLTDGRIDREASARGLSACGAALGGLMFVERVWALWWPGA